MRWNQPLKRGREQHDTALIDLRIGIAYNERKETEEKSRTEEEEKSKMENTRWWSGSCLNKSLCQRTTLHLIDLRIRIAYRKRDKEKRRAE